MNRQNKLSKIEYQVTQQGKTQDPYINKYYKWSQKGKYQCLVCGQLLFLSEDKFDSGSGWPAFSNQYNQNNIVKIIHKTSSKPKIQIKCSQCNSHLGHLFSGSTKSKTGLRYCVNSSSLQFIP